MLIQFTVSNFLSIKDPVTLSMVASSDTTLPGNTIDTGNDRFLTTAVIYGANASGKSNIIKALEFFQKLIVESHSFQKGSYTNSKPFLMDTKTTCEPSFFEAHFITNNIRYCYGFSCDNKEIHSEHLYYFPMGKKRTIFIRTKGNNFSFMVDKKKQKRIEEFTLENMLYLSKATQSNYEPMFLPFAWIKNTLTPVISYPYSFDVGFVGYTGQEIFKSQKIKDVVLAFLKHADVGINDIEVKRVETKIKEKNAKDEELSYEYSILAKHKPEDSESGTTMDIAIDNESNGTVKLFGLVGPLIDVLTNGYVLAYDEIDTRLHPILTRSIVSLFCDKQVNNHNAQLIFNTHDVNLLDADLFRRDQVWFTEKKEDGSTDLYPLSDFKPRKDDKLMKNYLLGRYGAIPIIGDAPFFCNEEK